MASKRKNSTARPSGQMSISFGSRKKTNSQAKKMGSAMKKAHSMTKEQIKPVKKTITVRVGYKKKFQQNLKKTMKLFGVK